MNLNAISTNVKTPVPTEAAKKKWTVMVYSCSDNNLYPFMQEDLDEAERVGSTANMNTVVETSHQPEGGSVERLQLLPDKRKGLHSPRLEDLGRHYDMAQPQSLTDFIEWGEKKFPAEHYMLVVADHGGGWQGACESESHNSWLSLPKLAQGLKAAQQVTGKKLDVLGFDACLMGSTEVVHELAPYASFIAGSEEVEGGSGWQYDDTTGQLRATRETRRSKLSDILGAADGAVTRAGEVTPRQMAETIVAMGRKHQGDLSAMTAVDTARVPALTEAVDAFGKAIVATPVSPAVLKRTAHETQQFEEFYDLSDFAGRVGKKAGKKDPELAARAAAVQAAVANAVVAEEHADKYPGAHGLTIELDRHGKRVGPPNVPDRIDFGSYADLALSRDTSWNLALQKINR